jgi:hypothetical protein
MRDKEQGKRIAHCVLVKMYESTMRKFEAKNTHVYVIKLGLMV